MSSRNRNRRTRPKTDWNKTEKKKKRRKNLILLCCTREESKINLLKWMDSYLDEVGGKPNRCLLQSTFAFAFAHTHTNINYTYYVSSECNNFSLQTVVDAAAAVVVVVDIEAASRAFVWALFPFVCPRHCNSSSKRKRITAMIDAKEPTPQMKISKIRN